MLDYIWFGLKCRNIPSRAGKNYLTSAGTGWELDQAGSQYQLAEARSGAGSMPGRVSMRARAERGLVKAAAAIGTHVGQIRKPLSHSTNGCA